VRVQAFKNVSPPENEASVKYQTYVELKNLGDMSLNVDELMVTVQTYNTFIANQHPKSARAGDGRRPRHCDGTRANMLSRPRLSYAWFGLASNLENLCAARKVLISYIMVYIIQLLIPVSRSHEPWRPAPIIPTLAPQIPMMLRITHCTFGTEAILYAHFTIPSVWVIVKFVIGCVALSLFSFPPRM